MGRTIQQWLLDGRSRGQMDGDERKAVWHEVFFNLAYATAVAAIVNYLIAVSAWDQPLTNGLHILAFVSLFLPLYFHWISHGLYLNRFDNSDYLHNVYQLCNVSFMCLAAANIDGCVPLFLSGGADVDHYGGCADFSFLMFGLRLTTVVMYARAAIYIPAKTLFCVRKCVELAVFAAVWLLNGFFQLYVYDWVTFLLSWWAVVVADMIVPLVTPRIFPQRVGFVAVNIDLLIERFGLFIVGALGNCVIAATLLSSTDNITMKSTVYAVSFMIICIAFSLKLTYHDANKGANDDIDLHAMRWHHWTGILWIMMHMPLTAGIIIMSGFFTHALSGNDLTQRQRWYLTGSISLTIFCLTFLQLLHKRSKHPVRVGPWVRIAAKMIVAVLILLSALVPPQYAPVWALFLFFNVAMFAYTLLDMFGNRAVEPSHASVSSTTELTSGPDLADIFSTDGIARNIHGMVVGGQLKGYNNLRMRGRDVSSAYI